MPLAGNHTRRLPRAPFAKTKRTRGQPFVSPPPTNDGSVFNLHDFDSLADLFGASEALVPGQYNHARHEHALSTPERALWWSVLVRGIQDTRDPEHAADARAWIADVSTDAVASFLWVTHVLGLNGEILSRAILGKLDAGTMRLPRIDMTPPRRRMRAPTDTTEAA